MQVTHRRRKAKRLGPERVTTDDLLDLVGSTYEAGVDHRRWPDMMQQTIRVMGNSGCHLLLTDSRTGRINRSVHFNMPDQMIQEYNSEVIHVCPRMTSGQRHPDRNIFWDYQHIDERGIDRSGYYDWLQRSGDNIRYYLAARLRPADCKEVPVNYLSLAFRRREGHASRAHIRLFARLVPHFSRALSTGQRSHSASPMPLTVANARTRPRQEAGVGICLPDVARGSDLAMRVVPIPADGLCRDTEPADANRAGRTHQSLQFKPVTRRNLMMNIATILKSLALSLVLATSAFAADKVNVNTADAATIAASLNGVGPAKAEAIVAYRKENGPFKSADQLAQVKGIGLATVDKNRDVIELGPTAKSGQ